MASGDVRPVKSSYSRGSWGGSSSHREYDDEGRGKSADLFEHFKAYYEADPTLKHLLEIDPTTAYSYIKYSVYRYDILDIANTHDSKTDSRARRLVVKGLGEEAWHKTWEYLVACYNSVVDRIKKEEHERAEKSKGEWAAYEALRKAEAARVEREDFETMQKICELSIGQFESELSNVVVPHDHASWGSGDYIDSVVEVVTDGGGWMEEDRKSVGTKIQITLSLDLSNSMIYNGIAKIAADTFRDVAWTMKALKAEHPDDLFVGFFTFSQDNWGGASDYGKKAVQLKEYVPYRSYEEKTTSEFSLGELANFAPSKMADSYFYRNLYDGHDTYVAPLFEEIERWEKEASDPGAVRLDLVITDAVLEHPKDIKEADVIQERRNGSLQSVMLNFMSEKDWLGSTLPKRTFMLKVDKDNVGGILRQVLAEFIGANM